MRDTVLGAYLRDTRSRGGARARRRVPAGGRRRCVERFSAQQFLLTRHTTDYASRDSATDLYDELAQHAWA